ncbi:MAG: response regulator transcription factor [Eubacterium sp.]|nr:response regulator transcription factor [Eubacterium sp.]
MNKICILEDDNGIREELSILLMNAGYETVEVEDYEEPVKAIMAASPDMVLLDINLPFKNGKDVLKELRKTSQIPVIMVTSSDTERDEIISMGYGADDYITKPYNPTLLLLRIGNIFKRMGAGANVETAHLGNVTIDFRRSMITDAAGTETVLTKNEMLILSYLYNHLDSIVSRDELMTDLWNNSEYLNDNALTVNISRLRNKLAAAGLEDAIETRKGQGYILSK